MEAGTRDVAAVYCKDIEWDVGWFGLRGFGGERREIGRAAAKKFLGGGVDDDEYRGVGDWS